MSTRELAPVIERCCSKAGDPDRVHRIDRVEIDLGILDAARLGPDFLARVAHVLPEALATAIGRSERGARERGGDPATDARLELLAYFARTGRLPWWVDADDRDRPQQALNDLVERPSRALAALLHELVGEPQALRRIALTFDDHLLGRLLALGSPSLRLQPGLRTEDLVVAARRAGSATGDRHLRAAAWTAVLRASLRRGASPPGSSPDDQLVAWRDVLAHFSVTAGASYSGLIDALHRPLAARGRSGATAGDLVDRLHQELPDVARAAADSDPTTGVGGDASDGVDERAAPATRPTTALGGEDPDTDGVDAPAGADEGEATPVPTSLPPDDDWVAAAPDLGFSDADTIYVENAGLVILWPFLERFFGRLGLLDGRRFRDEASAHRAAGLLQYAATGDRSPPEHRLALNKVLCGIEPDEVFDFGDPVTDDEAEEGNDLLRAVVAQAPILRDMSIPALRGTFLVRDGALTMRDGAWLLRVERQTHDVVLDRFPWTVAWVALPWTPRPLRVEW